MRLCFYFIIAAVLFIPILLSPTLAQKLDIEAKTKTYGGVNAGGEPGWNVAAIWIQTPQNEFINVCMVYSEYGFDIALKNWRTITGFLDTGTYDGITTATRTNHDEPMRVSWDCKDPTDTQVPAGTYEYWIEMTESDYFWLDGEEYQGKVTKGSIEIDFQNENTDTGTATDNIFDIYAKFVPVGIIVDAPQKRLNTISFTYNQLSKHLMIELGALSYHSGVTRIYDLRGTIIKTISFTPNTQIIHWDGKNSAGCPLPSGIYLFEIRSNDEQIKPSLFSATLLK